MFILFGLFIAAMPVLVASFVLLVLCCAASRSDRARADASLPRPDPGYVERGLEELQAFLQQASGHRHND